MLILCKTHFYYKSRDIIIKIRHLSGKLCHTIRTAIKCSNDLLFTFKKINKMSCIKLNIGFMSF